MTILIYKVLLLSSLMLSFSFCTFATKEKRNQKIETADTFRIDHTARNVEVNVATKSRTAMVLDSLGLIEISTLDSTLLIDLMYARADNFTGEVLYGDLREAYLHPDAAKALLLAHKILKKRQPVYRFIVYDATRPMSVQKKMWNKVKGTPKYMYVSNPARGGGLHNYGLAVDISLADSLGNPLPMGTKVDHFGPEAHISQEAELVRSGKISNQELRNRQLLRQVMREAGFRTITSEWWHFNLCSREVARRKYALIP